MVSTWLSQEPRIKHLQDQDLNLILKRINKCFEKIIYFWRKEHEQNLSLANSQNRFSKLKYNLQ